MSIGKKWAALSQTPAVRTALVGIGFVLIALTPLVGPIPGPGGIIVFGAGLSLVLKYSGWAKRFYVRLKRKHPNKGDWADWSLRRGSAKRRRVLVKEREAAELAAGFAPDVPPAEASLPCPQAGELGRDQEPLRARR